MNYNKNLLSKLDNEVNNIVSNMKKSKHYESTKKLSKKVERALKDLEENHNTSWAVEMYNRNKDNLDNIALFYRGNKISYGLMFELAYKYASSLKEMGFNKNDIIPICVSNIPEFIYLMLASSFIGAKINVVGDWFDKDYLKNIINTTNSKAMFVSLDNYNYIKDIIEQSNIENIVLFSLADSLIKDEYSSSINPYLELELYKDGFINNIELQKTLSKKNILSQEDFLKLSKDNKLVLENVQLDDPFAITYTSGTTDPGCPKGCIHTNRSYITLSRFKEQDVSGLPSMRNMTVLAHIPTYTHMELSCAISDTLYEKCTLALEPFYTKDFFTNSLLINKPNFVPASTGFWTTLCDNLNYNPKYSGINLQFLMIPTVTGEGMSKGEEKYFNFTSRKHKFGTEKLPFPLAPVTFSIGGGTTESSGIFVTLYKSLQEKNIKYALNKEGLGLTPHKFVDLEVLNKEGKYCKINEPGLLVATSPCNMLSYTDEKLNKNIKVTDYYGKEWLSLGTYSYKSDKIGRIKMKGRLNSNIIIDDTNTLPYYLIEDTVELDTKNIMSSSLVKLNDNEYVCHVKLQPNAKNSNDEILSGIMNRLKLNIPEIVLNKLYIKVRNSFYLAPSGKKDNNKLIEEGITPDTISCYSYFNNNDTKKKTLKK